MRACKRGRPWIAQRERLFPVPNTRARLLLLCRYLSEAECARAHAPAAFAKDILRRAFWKVDPARTGTVSIQQFLQVGRPSVRVSLFCGSKVVKSVAWKIVNWPSHIRPQTRWKPKLAFDGAHTFQQSLRRCPLTGQREATPLLKPMLFLLFPDTTKSECSSAIELPFFLESRATLMDAECHL